MAGPRSLSQGDEVMERLRNGPEGVSDFGEISAYGPPLGRADHPDLPRHLDDLAGHRLQPIDLQDPPDLRCVPCRPLGHGGRSGKGFASFQAVEPKRVRITPPNHRRRAEKQIPPKIRDG